jgi:hypothetical protein
VLHHHPPRLQDDLTHLGPLAPRLILVGVVLGVIGLGGGFLLGLSEGDGLRRYAFSYLISFAYFLTLSLGALFFVALQHLTRAGWSVVVRRPAEIAAALLPLLAIFALPILLNLRDLYPWTATPGAHGDLLAQKRAYLNVPFYWVRWLAYFLVWGFLGQYFWRRSLAQDRSGDPRITVRLESHSGPALVAFAVTVTLASIDLLMSLDPFWYSTIFGVYVFSGAVAGFFALLTLLVLKLQWSGRLVRVVSIEHFHDFGKLMFAFVFFWAYIAFSQYMLIWYANIPEETAWILRRQENGWGTLSLVLLAVHFFLPFLGLISRYAKRNRSLLGFWAIWILAAHWLDLYWLAMPELQPGGPTLNLMDLLNLVGLAGFYLAGLAWLAGNRSLVPVRDPRLADSLAFENA